MSTSSRYDMRAASLKQKEELIAINPCYEEEELQKKCMNDHCYNTKECEYATENYKLCKEFWRNISKKRRKQGLLPLVPPPEEREQIRKEHIKKVKEASQYFKGQTENLKQRWGID